MVATAPDHRPLVGTTVRLDDFRPGDVTGLFAALDDPRVWATGFGGGPSGRPRTVDDFRSLMQRRVVAGQHPYTARLVADSGYGAAGDIVGTSTLLDVDLTNERLHLGWTAYAPAVWSGRVNPECKLVLLGHAFDDCGMERVKIQTDLINTRSQDAIARLGAVREGVLRHHMVRADGSRRDTVVFSILRSEWPEVRRRLQERLGTA